MAASVSASCLISLSSLAVVLVALASAASAQLSSTFYDRSCPNALSTIRSGVNSAVRQEPRVGASLLRLHFHDCFVRGCDASLLLNDTSGEQSQGPNLTLNPRGFVVVNSIKAQVESVCPGIVSCADILAVAARDGVVALGGPSWTVLLGRRDSTASFPGQTSDLPPPTSSLRQLLSAYNKKNLNPTDMVALSGAHTIGQAQCSSFNDHIYNDTNINSAFAASLRANCPRAGSTALAPLDTTTPNAFDNAYYTNLLSQKGLLHSDQELFNSGSTDSTVRSFASSTSAFNSAFATAMVKMGNLSPQTGTQGQIRRSCWKVNS
ncbi:peroxidase 66 precursor [Zea mays]|uniref:Peroxidase n=1 Tax=Zea mays TaxID=4577 RepID=A0A1D6F4C8_MAIZE|nr:peroxidase 66 precursor [Zea mays]ONM26184.1 Peroxidase 66 [Zea mays]|eukprot:NP_001295387.1 peroxidase 66 precursor [Zea mays]